MLLDRKKYNMFWPFNVRSEKANENKNQKKKTRVINKENKDIVHAIRKVGLFRSVSLFNKNIDIKFSALSTFQE